MKLPKKCQLDRDDAGIRSSNGKDVEANAERESGERFLGKIQNRKAGFVRLGNLVQCQIGEADDEEKFASLMADQNIGTITLEEALIFSSKRFREYKGRSSGQ
jgi:DNA topoisomerase-1